MAVFEVKALAFDMFGAVADWQPRVIPEVVVVAHDRPAAPGIDKMLLRWRSFGEARPPRPTLTMNTPRTND